MGGGHGRPHGDRGLRGALLTGEGKGDGRLSVTGCERMKRTDDPGQDQRSKGAQRRGCPVDESAEPAGGGVGG